ncbi:autophagy-related protein 13b-like isoform X2 [Punica granatum]|uniref:Autophagy-related protein 13b-like isoform X2 n=1 Tax=Punica granatum TaxID=22663 RepID=A0A6P8E8K6_PUNGR|nr:autophagy-related protein 13b-like isoform X2 [Punica granatum]
MAAPHSDAAKMEQIITEFFAKSLHVILESRTPCVPSSDTSGEKADSSRPSLSDSSSSGVRPRDKWFNLALKECPAVFDSIDTWNWSNPECMVIDVILIKKVVDSVSGDHSEAREEGEERNEKIIERWVVKYEVKRAESEGPSKGRKRSGKSILSALYKKSILLLRSLYTTVRLLPAYKVFRQLSLSSSLCSCFLAHKVSSFAEPLDPKEEAKMQLRGFAPLYTSCGKLCLSVLYLSRMSEVVSQTSSMPVAPKFIPDYVGNPLTEPVKSFPSLSEAPAFLPSRQYYSANSPPSFASSPSSTHSDSCALPPPHPLVSASSRDKGADETGSLMQAGAAVNTISFSGRDECDERKPLRNFQDEFSYSEITCVFDVAGNNPTNSSSRFEKTQIYAIS